MADPLPYFPFPDASHEMRMDASVLPVDRLIEVDSHYAEEIALKRDILAQDRRYHCRLPPSPLPMQWEAPELLLPNMARHDPEQFTLETDGERWSWTNRLLSTRTAFTLGEEGALPLPPLEWVGRQ